jgi:hypothetical protein
MSISKPDSSCNAGLHEQELAEADPRSCRRRCAVGVDRAAVKAGDGLAGSSVADSRTLRRRRSAACAAGAPRPARGADRARGDLRSPGLRRGDPDAERGHPADQRGARVAAGGCGARSGGAACGAARGERAVSPRLGRSPARAHGRGPGRRQRFGAGREPVRRSAGARLGGAVGGADRPAAEAACRPRRRRRHRGAVRCRRGAGGPDRRTDRGCARLTRRRGAGAGLCRACACWNAACLLAVCLRTGAHPRPAGGVVRQPGAGRRCAGWLDGAGRAGDAAAAGRRRRGARRDPAGDAGRTQLPAVLRMPGLCPEAWAKARGFSRRPAARP